MISQYNILKLFSKCTKIDQTFDDTGSSAVGKIDWMHFEHE